MASPRAQVCTYISETKQVCKAGPRRFHDRSMIVLEPASVTKECACFTGEECTAATYKTVRMNLYCAEQATEIYYMRGTWFPEGAERIRSQAQQGQQGPV